MYINFITVFNINGYVHILIALFIMHFQFELILVFIALYCFLYIALFLFIIVAEPTCIDFSIETKRVFVGMDSGCISVSWCSIAVFKVAFIFISC